MSSGGKEDKMLNFLSAILLYLLAPQQTIYICWATDTKVQECGTYGWAPTKKAALEAALNLCSNKCSNACYIEYCETTNRINRKERP